MNMCFNIKQITLFVALIMLSGCGKISPIVASRKDVERLSSSERIVQARGLPDEHIASLARLRHLEQLDFSGGWAVCEARITDKGLKSLAQLDLPHLERLILGHCSHITDNGLLDVSAMQRLTLLNLWHCPQITDAGLPALSRMQNLNWLSLMACPKITDMGLPTLLLITNLTALDLRGCPGITDRGLDYLAAKTNWQTIMLGGCTNVTVEAVERLHRALPHADVRKDEREWSWMQRE